MGRWGDRETKKMIGRWGDGEAFRFLKEKEEREFGEYRTRRLVLEGCTANVGILFRDNDHWQRGMGAYMQGILTQSFPETWLEFESGGSMIMLIRSLPIVEVSPPKSIKPSNQYWWSRKKSEKEIFVIPA